MKIFNSKSNGKIGQLEFIEPIELLKVLNILEHFNIKSIDSQKMINKKKLRSLSAKSTLTSAAINLILLLCLRIETTLMILIVLYLCIAVFLLTFLLLNKLSDYILLYVISTLKDRDFELLSNRVINLISPLLEVIYMSEEDEKIHILLYVGIDLANLNNDRLHETFRPLVERYWQELRSICIERKLDFSQNTYRQNLGYFLRAWNSERLNTIKDGFTYAILKKAMAHQI